MVTKFRVECFKDGSFKKSRKFTTAEKAVEFANNWHDDHDAQWDVQIVTPAGAIHQACTNGNMSVAVLKGSK